MAKFSLTVLSVFYICFNLAAATSCKVSGFTGTCQYTNKACSGSYTPGHCPGPSNFQCCHSWGTCVNAGKKGTCQATSKTCAGSYTPGLCPGPSNIQCCTDWGTCKVGSIAGKCQATGSKCSGSYAPGYCPGPSNIQCCADFGTCKVGSVSGKCQSTSAKCDGSYTPGHCPGPANVQCCAKTTTGGGGGSGCPPTVNAATVSLIKEFEGFVESPEDDPTGNPTVGYGHLCEETDCKEVTDAGYSFPLSESEAASLLQSDLKSYESCLRKALGSSKLNANQYGALVSWTYNNGCGNAASSTLVERINDGDSVNTVCEEELPKWNKASGEVLPGLTRRRAAEVDLCQTSTTSAALPC